MHVQARLKESFDLDVDRSDIVACVAKAIYDDQEGNEQDPASLFFILGVSILGILLEKKPSVIEQLADIEKEAKKALTDASQALISE